MKQVRLGQTEHGSFVVTMMAPVPPLLQPMPDESWARFSDEPHERQVTRRLVQALEASRDAAELAHSGAGAPAFERAVADGVSANLCESLVELIGAFSSLDIRVTWARTCPERSSGAAIRFFEPDVQHLDAASRLFREFEPQPNAQLVGAVVRLRRAESDSDGNITLRAEVEGQPRSVTADLNPLDYSLAIQAHRDKAAIIATGTLERIGERWRLLNPSITGTVPLKLDESALQSKLPMTPDD